MLREGYEKSLFSFNIINQTVNAQTIQTLFKDAKFDLIMGSSILHHLLDYDQVIEALSEMLTDNGVMYFVREPIHRNECQPSNTITNFLERFYHFVNALLMSTKVRKYFWPNKIKAEDSSSIAYHMYKEGISTAVFKKLTQQNFSIIFMRKYNRRVSSFLSYLENAWLGSLRKDIFGNTLFSICLQKSHST